MTRAPVNFPGFQERSGAQAPAGAGRRLESAVVARTALAVLLGLSAVQCGPSRPKLVPVVVTWEMKVAWMLQLEDERVLRAPAPAMTPPVSSASSRKAGGAVSEPPPPPDLFRLTADRDPRVRRRAALAIGRVGLREGAATLAALLGDTEPEVRQMAAFALGLLRSREAATPLRAALNDANALVRGRAAEALGSIGDVDSATAIAAMAAASLRASGAASFDPDDEAYPKSGEAEAFRLGIYALARLKAWPALSQCVLDGSGRPAIGWWPVAYALQRVANPAAVPALLSVLRSEGRIAKAFAARGLGALKEKSAAPPLVPIAEAWRTDPRVAVESIRALGQIGSPEGIAPLRKLLSAGDLTPNLRLEVVAALARLGDTGSLDRLTDLLVDPWPEMRIAALRAVHDLDQNTFTMSLSGLDPDPDWRARAALAPLLATLDPNVAALRLKAMLGDRDRRVVPSVVGALSLLKRPDLGTTLAEALKDDDLMVRAAAAEAIGKAKIAGLESALADAYRAASRDAGYQARAAALTALAESGAAAVPMLKEALGDKDWAVRVQAATLLGRLEPAFDPAPSMRPAPARPAEAYAVPQLVQPTVSPHVYLDTSKGTVEIELAVIDAPQTCDNFIRLARQGYFTGLTIHRVVPDFVVQDGDNRGDGEGGPGYTIRDEINQIPYLRGTVGMALDWADTGGSQFFIALAPQPHLDARYTAFGRVVSGMEVADRLEVGDQIRRVRVWDGIELVVR